ncbi:PH domain-containing protein [Micromonospora sp. NPDC049274]|uniref:PH domain-containing protein n=1 Tax=Micromonospora sp. NPDC049274 TaxID=3154829 RepID=UPI003435DB9C
MRRWQRPYSLDSATAFAMLGLVVAAVVAPVLAIVVVREPWVPTPLAVLFEVWLAVCLAVAVRQAMLGVYVSEDGIRSRTLLRTATVPWESVADIHSGIATIAGLDMGRSAITIERTDGISVQTALQRGDLLRPFTFRPELGRLATWPEHYDEILTTLRAYHRDARPRHAAQAGGPARTVTPDAGTTSPAVRLGGLRSGSGGPTADQRRDVHALTRQHERGALTDAELAAALAKIRGASGG